MIKRAIWNYTVIYIRVSVGKYVHQANSILCINRSDNQCADTLYDNPPSADTLYDNQCADTLYDNPSRGTHVHSAAAHRPQPLYYENYLSHN